MSVDFNAIVNDFAAAQLAATDERFYRVAQPATEAHCEACGATEGLRDSEECWACYDERKADEEAFSRFGGDV